jgi:hypothetical protein
VGGGFDSLDFLSTIRYLRQNQANNQESPLRVFCPSYNEVADDKFPYVHNIVNQLIVSFQEWQMDLVEVLGFIFMLSTKAKGMIVNTSGSF